jgi:hypothetical protein
VTCEPDSIRNTVRSQTGSVSRVGCRVRKVGLQPLKVTEGAVSLPHSKPNDGPSDG